MTIKVTVTFDVDCPPDTEVSEVRATIYDGLELPGYMLPKEWRVTAMGATAQKR